MEQLRRRLFALLLVSALLVGFTPLRASAALTSSDFEGCLLSEINSDRVSVGAGRLEMAWDRIEVVRAWSEWMSDNAFRHMTTEEREPALPHGTTTWGENIAMHYYTEGDCSHIHSMLMNSSGHRANILNSSFRFVALGAHRDASGWWVTELFFDAYGYPPPADPCEPGRDCDTIALQQSSGLFTIWDHLGEGASPGSFYFGNPGDVPFSGDWDCDGVETLGLYRRSDGYVYLRNSNSQGVADISFYFGNPGDYPIAGDFNGNGCDTVSIYRPSESSFHIVNRLGSRDGGLGAADYSFYFGNPGDKPFIGDYDGDGVDTIGLHRESTGLVYLRNSSSSGLADISFIYGDPGDVLVAGDWDGDGKDSVGVFRPSSGMVYLRYSNTPGPAHFEMRVGSYSSMSAINP